MSRQHTTRPIVTGTSVVAIKYANGILMAADTLGSYGSLARYTNIKRILQCGNNDTIVGASGDISDLQEIEKFLRNRDIEDKCEGDGLYTTPKETLHTLASLMYQKRSKMQPLWNDLVVAGFNDEDGGFILGTTDKIGTMYEDDFIATGFGMHLALPILRDNFRPGMTEEEARAVLEKCMKVLYYRDCRTMNKILFGKVTPEGAEISDVVELETEWSYPLFVKSNTDLDTPY